MIARSSAVETYSDWNARHRAPFGRIFGQDLLEHPKFDDWLHRHVPKELLAMVAGPFTVQQNNTTRTIEYPWAIYQVLGAARHSDILEIGGGLSGLQFVLSRLGAKVTNVDPGNEAKGKGWPCTERQMKSLNRVFRTKVRLLTTTIDRAEIPSESADVVLSVSVIEHFTACEFESTIHHVHRILRPGGRFVVTADLFKDLYPFTSVQRNEWGCNYPIGNYLGHPGFTLVTGEPSEIYGTREFSAENILARQPEFYVGLYAPVLTQMFVLEKV